MDNNLVKMTLINLLNGITEFEDANGSSKLAVIFDDLTDLVRKTDEISDEDVYQLGEQIANIYFEYSLS
jgi:hypothetical protein